MRDLSCGQHGGVGRTALRDVPGGPIRRSELDGLLELPGGPLEHPRRGGLRGVPGRNLEWA